MKPLLFIFIVLILTSCQKPARDNPWDEFSTLGPEEWAPTSFSLTVNTLSSVTLSWQQSIETIEGFRIDRKQGLGEWQTTLASLGNSQNSYIDDAINLPAEFTYRVYAFAGKNTSSYVESRIGIPTVTTTEISNINAITATSGGNVTFDGGFPVTAHGVVWSTSPNPTISDSLTNNGTGTGSFISQLTGLNDATTYFVRAYAINAAGTSYGIQVEFTTAVGYSPTVTTNAISNIAPTTATSGGNITTDGGFPISARGVVWSTSQNPTTSNNLTNDGSDMGLFTSQLSELIPVTTYYIRAYAINSAGTAYGSQVQFTTSVGNLPTVSTNSSSDITTTSAASGGDVTEQGDTPVFQRGVCWSTSPSPTTSNSLTSNGTGTGSFTSQITGLTINTTYYVRAYAINTAGTAYGSQMQFTTSAGNPPTVTTSGISNIGTTTATSGGNVSAQGGTPVTQRGVCWSTSPSPTTSNSITTDGTGTGSFISQITGLNAGTTYFLRAYAINAAGPSYGIEVEFTSAGDVYNPVTGKTWMDRNLGASRVAQSSTDDQAYGDLYQWGRGTDGHEKRTSSTTTTLSTSDTPGHSKYILAADSPNNWRNPHNPNLWQGGGGTNNPCPSGYRLPTEAEWNFERLSWSSNNAAGAFASPLKLPVAGNRSYNDGSLITVGTICVYWTSSLNGDYSRVLYFTTNDSFMSNSRRAFGAPVRCIKN